MKYTHLLYVRKYSIITNNTELVIVGVNTNDIFHTIGEYIYRSETRVADIRFAPYTDERAKYWSAEGYTIHSFRDIYNDKDVA